ncbi:Cytochrome c oxidase copper chaperone [Zancudomyces culisetae]|uniref:Cytochrome c oxidase copper chaperone n=1 Tax=Zancudomyces culisetae TaxID=1213189 RepID=A0A1R1PHE2_ZANCU|nr:Cytochrome c oxidase copper chaperone [Zancudomyces culisetae]OMH82996.1 Cytochrome c oxidase copper chaperone [Zancudomyces culisetae]|eukprot:OMH80396.1 Cytochrome c oxidase copper chaperone [Zancudomyces culisetae]
MWSFLGFGKSDSGNAVEKKELPNNATNTEKPKPCCACPDTKRARDQCFLDKGDSAEQDCHHLIIAHRECMASFGYKV